MSLSRLAMRIAAARALRGATLEEARVHDSAIAPIDQTIAEERQPILIVTTDDHELEVTGRDLFHGNVSCDLVIEAAIAARVEVAGEESVITIPHTNEGMELALDLMEHQVMAALTRERSDWSRVWMKLVPRISRRLSRRGASVEKGVRFAARQIVLTCDLIEPPTDGAVIAEGTAWADLLSVMEEDADLIREPGSTELDQGIAMAAALCDLPLDAMDEMDAADFAAISEVLGGFLPKVPA